MAHKISQGFADVANYNLLFLEEITVRMYFNYP